MYIKQTSADAGKAGFGIKIDSIKLNDKAYDVPAKWQGVSADAVNGDGIFDAAFYNQWGPADGNIGDGTGKDLANLQVTEAEITFTVVSNTEAVALGGDTPGGDDKPNEVKPGGDNNNDDKKNDGDKPLGDTVMIFAAVAALAACVAVTAKKSVTEK